MKMLSLTLFYAVQWIATHQVCADPRELLEFCVFYCGMTDPWNDLQCRILGERAARDAAQPMKQVQCDLTKEL